MIGFLIYSATSLATYIGYNVAKLFVYYYFYLLLIIIFKILLKLRSEVYNEDCKLKPTGEHAILITGATSGIGLALSKYFYRKGYSVIACYYSDQEPGYNELKSVEKKSDRSVYFVPLDVRSEESIAMSYERVKEILAFDGMTLHALVNNAGISSYSKTEWFSKAQIRSTVETNLLGPMLMVKQYTPLLAKAKSSRIVNISSALRYIPGQFTSIYGATKAGLSFYSNAARLDLQKYGIKIVAVHPGNLIKNTRIIANTVEDLSRAYNDSTVEEREMIKDDLDKHKKAAAKTIEGINKTQELTKGQRASRPCNRGISLKMLLAISFGCIENGVNLEDSSFMNSFDNAIRMKDPPCEMTAGNKYFNIIHSTLFEEMGLWTWRNIGTKLGDKLII